MLIPLSLATGHVVLEIEIDRIRSGRRRRQRPRVPAARFLADGVDQP